MRCVDRLYLGSGIVVVVKRHVMAKCGLVDLVNVDGLGDFPPSPIMS
jgi:hypothetical protein